MPTTTIRHADQTIELSYRERGKTSRDQAALLLLHGAGGSSLGFVELLNLLGQHRRVVALDLPGHGRSASWPSGSSARDSSPRESSPREAPAALLDGYRDVVANFAERIGLGRFALVGHSMGGAVAQRFAATYGDRLASLVLLASGARLALGEPLRRLLAHRVDDLPRFVAAHGFSPATAEATAERLTEVALQAGEDVVRADFAACDRFDERHRLGRLTIGHQLTLVRPPLVLGGADDQIVPPSASEELAALIPRARLELLPRAGHWLFLERPGAVARALLELA